MSTKIIAGLDEAGLGPRLGPLVVTLVGFESRENGFDLEDLDRALEPVRDPRASSSGPGLRVDDSKRIYSGGKGFEHLEKTAQAFFRAGCERPPRTLGDWLAGLSGDTAPDLDECPWFGASPGKQPLPRRLDAAGPAEATGRLRETLDRAGIRPLRPAQEVLTAPELNRRILRYGNKARAEVSAVLDLVKGLLDEAPRECDITILSDKLGGRAYYGELIADLLPFRPVETLEEGPARSRYRVRLEDGVFTLGFYRGGDGLYLPIALASIFSKYTRELLMERFNAFFLEKAPSLRPTAGYPADAPRFLDAVRPILQAEGIDPSAPVRIR